MAEMIELKPKIKPFYTSLFADNSMPLLKNIVIVDKDFSSKHAFMEHMHNHTLELLFVISGNNKYSINGVPYQLNAGDLAICNAGVLHGEKPHSRRSVHSICCGLTNVNLTALPPNCLIDQNTCPILHCGKYSKDIAKLMETLYDFAKENDVSIDICSSIVVSILLLVRELLHRLSNTIEINDTDYLAKRIKEYLNKHFCDPISLKSIASSLHINAYYLSHIFKNKTGYSPMQYVMLLRIGKAQSLLRFTQQPIGDIAYMLGFNTSSHFDTVFMKNVNMSPSEYRFSFRKP